MNELDRADVDASRRLIRDQQRQVTRHLTGHDHLLLIAARQGGDRVLDRRQANVVFLFLVAGVACDRAALEGARGREGGGAELVEHQVVRDRKRGDDAVRRPVLGNKSDARVQGFTRLRTGNVRVLEPDRATVGGAQAQDHFGELRLPVALYACDCEDLAAGNVERHVVKQRHSTRAQQGHVLEGQATASGTRGILLHAHQHLTPDHLRGQRGLGIARGRVPHDPTAANDRDLVGDRTHLAQLVGDEHDRGPGIGELTHDRHQLVRFLRGEHRRRLIENEDLRLARQGLDDLHALLGAHRQILNEGVGIQVKAETRRDLAHRLAGTLAADDSGRTGRLKAQCDRLGDREDGDEHEVLVHHADARRDRVARPLERHGLAVNEDLPLVRGVHPVQDVHERGLTRAILSQQGVNVPFLDR